MRARHLKFAGAVAFALALILIGPASVGRAAAPRTVITPIVVTPASSDWTFINDNGTVGGYTAGFQNGPATPPLGVGSYHMALTSASAGILFGTQKYQGTLLSDIQALSYSTYTNQSPQAMAFQINYDPDVTTVEASTWYGRLIYEPYLNGTVTNNTWQTWDMINGGSGKWWASPNGNSTVDEDCPQASPCTWTKLITDFPNIGIRNDALSFIQFKAGSNWNGFSGNFDNFSIEIGSATDTYDFELPSTVYVDASWSGTTPGTDPDGAGPATSFGADSFATIQDGVNGVATGGTVSVAAGTYNESLITIDHALALTGAGAATTIVDGGAVVAGDGLVKVTNPAGPVSISGFTLQDAGGDVAGTISLITIDHSANSAPVTVEHNHLVGRNNGSLFDIGLWSYSTDGGLTVQDNEFDHMWQGVLLERPRGGGSVLNNNFHDLQAGSDGTTLYEAEGIFAFTYSADNVSSLVALNGNSFSAYNGSAIAMGGGYPGHTPAQFTDAQIEDNTINSIGSGPERRHIGIYLINYGTTSGDAASGGIPNAVISGNTLTTGGAGSYGILLSGPSNNLTISHNFVTGIETGIGTNEKYTGAGFSQGVTVEGNSLTGNTTAVADGSSAAADMINASGNWWGCASGPGALGCDTVSSNVDYTPWLDGGTDTSGSAGFQGDFSALTVNTASPQFGSTGRIQEGIEMSSGSTVNIAAGTYTENIVVDKSVELAGADRATTIVEPAVSDPNCGDNSIGASLCSGASNIILVQANNVHIHDLTLEGNNPSLTSGQVFGSQDIDARNGIITNHTLGTYNGLEVDHVTVQNIFLRGMYASSGGTFNFHDNSVTNVQATYYSIAMFAYGGGPGYFTNNTVSFANDAISANHSKGIQFVGNTVTNSGSGVHTDNAGDGGGSADLIQNNTISDCNTAAGGYGIFVFVPYLAPTVNGNTITNCKYGISDWGQGAAVTPSFTNNSVDGSSLAGSQGFRVSSDLTDIYGAMYTDVTVSLSGNTFTGNDTGVVLTTYPSYTVTITSHCDGISGNTAGVTTAGGGSLTNDFTNDWWGHATGPTVASNPTGTGDSVVAGINYSPWSSDSGCSVFVPPYPTTATITADSNNPSFPGQSATFDFTISNNIAGGPVPAGTVDFSDGSTVVCSAVALDGAGHGQCIVTFTTGSYHLLKASFTPTDSGQFVASEGTRIHKLLLPSSDFEGDRKSDPAKFYPSNGTVWWLKSSTSAWDGMYLGSDVTSYLPRSDFDGDGKVDPAKWVASSNTIWYFGSSDSTWHGFYMGSDVASLLPGSDFDGDGRTDPAKYIASGYVWYFGSRDSAWHGFFIGTDGDPLAGSDFDGDGKTDPAKYVASSGTIWYLSSKTMTWVGFGIGTDGTPVPASDYDGDGKTDPAKYVASSNTLWYFSSVSSTWEGIFSGPGTYQYVPGNDFDGDGKTDPATFNPSTGALWYRESSTSTWQGVVLGADTFDSAN